jgi:hypothetical protein
LKTSPADIPKEVGRLNICSTPTNYLLTNKLSELIHRSSSEPKLAEIIDGVFLINLVDFWHTVEFSRIRRTPQRPVFRPKPLWGNSSNLHGAFAPVKLGECWCSAIGGAPDLGGSCTPSSQATTATLGGPPTSVKSPDSCL